MMLSNPAITGALSDLPTGLTHLRINAEAIRGFGFAIEAEVV